MAKAIPRSRLHARRALVLVLDEPTAALDAETEHALFERYAAQVRGDGGRVTILVSHRFSTVRMADQIIVLDGSRVVEAGSHDDLMANMRTSTKYKQRRTASSPELDRDVLWVKNGS